jgi:plastocyanin
MNRRLGLLAFVCALIAAVGATTADAASKTAVITTKGGDSFAPNPKAPPNLLDINDFRWAPGTITVHSGETLKLVDGDKSREPHVLAIALPRDMPKSLNINPATNKVLRMLAPELLVDPTAPQSAFKAYQTNAGPNGLNEEGDAMVILPGGPHKTATWFVSAKPGTVLHYFCAIHWWMRGTIKVVK